MKKIILPTITKSGFVEKVRFTPNLVIGTTVGLVKDINEDKVGCLLKDHGLRVCIADGHWGTEAARLITNHWLKNKGKFPSSKTEAIKETKIIENKLFKKFGMLQMDSKKDFTPEASFIAIEIIKNKISIVSYGDCRLLIANNGVKKFSIKTNNTWLGAFSHLQLRKRISINKATIFKQIQLVKGDFVFMFTDGIDQCIYGKDTISIEFISKLSNKTDLSEVFDVLFCEVFTKGAEDNASLAIFRFR